MFFLLLFLSFSLMYGVEQDIVTIAILAKDKAHVLPLFLKCIENQTWPKSKTYLYIRTNNNKDATVQILQEWLLSLGHQYAGFYFNDQDVQESVEIYGHHEWNSVRFKVLGKIRQDSVDWAYVHNSHYLVVDCDNFIKPYTLEALIKTNLDIVAPFLVTGHNFYSNFHAAIDENGYFQENSLYFDIFNQKICGLIKLPVVHCTYFIQHHILPHVSYDDNSFRYEYVIFSDHARKKNICQYLDNREIYGYISFAETYEKFTEEPWIQEVESWFLK